MRGEFSSSRVESASSATRESLDSATREFSASLESMGARVESMGVSS